MTPAFVTLATAFGTLLLAALGVVALYFEFRHLVHAVRAEQRADREELLHRTQALFDIAMGVKKDKREEENLGIEERRLAEVNIKLAHRLLLTEPAANLAEARRETPFTIFSLRLENDGDGPVDILASITASRIMSSKYKVGMGLRNRDVEWRDQEAHFWNHGDPDGLFSGTSTSRTMVSAEDEFLRLAPHERGTLRRIDAVNNTELLIKRAPVYMLYRVFLVARGYPLGEILRQLGAVPPNLLQNVNQEQLQFRTIAQPNYGRWRAVQEALLTLTRMAFKIASDEEDALGLLAEPDAWRFFLLHHQEFVGPIVHPNGSVTTMDAVAQGFWEYYPDKILPPNFGQDEQYPRAKAYCREQLMPLLEKWRTLRRVIEECKLYDPLQGYPPGLFTPVAPVKDYPKEAYPARIHTDPVYRERWLDLMRDGYLISLPFPREKNIVPYGQDISASSPGARDDQLTPIEGQIGRYDAEDIPADPRVLEPYVMRIHYFLNTLTVPKLQYTDSPPPN